jgi:hypothetical protein
MKIFILLLLLSVAGCTKKPAEQQQAVNNMAQAIIGQAPIKGIWWSPEQYQSAAFQIKDTSIYYPDMLVEYRYELNGDRLLVYRPEGVASSYIVQATADTLILSTMGRQQIYTRAQTRQP